MKLKCDPIGFALEAGVKVEKAMERVRLDEYSEATRRVSKAISHITTLGGRAMQILKQRDLL